MELAWSLKSVRRQLEHTCPGWSCAHYTSEDHLRTPRAQISAKRGQPLFVQIGRSDTRNCVSPAQRLTCLSDVCAGCCGRYCVFLKHWWYIYMLKLPPLIFQDGCACRSRPNRGEVGVTWASLQMQSCNSNPWQHFRHQAHSHQHIHLPSSCSSQTTSISTHVGCFELHSIESSVLLYLVLCVNR